MCTKVEWGKGIFAKIMQTSFMDEPYTTGRVLTFIQNEYKTRQCHL